MKQYEEVSVLEHGDDGAVVSISGQENPLVLLKPAYLEHLVLLSDKADQELLRVPERFETRALKQLCAEIQTFADFLSRDMQQVLRGHSGRSQSQSSAGRG